MNKLAQFKRTVDPFFLIIHSPRRSKAMTDITLHYFLETMNSPIRTYCTPTVVTFMNMFLSFMMNRVLTPAVKNSTCQAMMVSVSTSGAIHCFPGNIAMIMNGHTVLVLVLVLVLVGGHNHLLYVC